LRVITAGAKTFGEGRPALGIVWVLYGALVPGRPGFGGPALRLFSRIPEGADDGWTGNWSSGFLAPAVYQARNSRSGNNPVVKS